MLPLSFFSLPRNAHPVIPALLARAFARSLPKNIFGNSRNLRPINGITPPIRNGTWNARDVFNIIDGASDMLDIAGFLSATFWKSEEKNPASIMINNTNNEEKLNTEEIFVSLQKKSEGKIEIETVIEPISIPPQSRLILNLEISGHLDPGTKQIHGKYNNGVNIEPSGDIFVRNNTHRKIKTIDQHIEDYYS